MQRLWISLILYGLSFFLNCLSAVSKTDIIYIHLFSTEKFIKNITIASVSEITPLKVTIDNSNKIFLSLKSKRIFLLRGNNEKQPLPKSFYLASKNKSPICIGVNNISKRCYKGKISLSYKNDSVYLVNEVSVQDYLNSVVSSELPSNWPMEAVKAQAISAHTYLSYFLKSNKTIKDSTENQFYGGTEYINPKYVSSISEVKNILLLDKNKEPINALYHSTCEGKTYNNNYIFGGKPDKHLRSVRCLYNTGSPFSATKVFKIPKQSLLKKLNAKEISIVRNKDKSIFKINLDNKLYSIYEFWLYIGKKLGWGKVPGISYDIRCSKTICEFKSKGAGHGVGMCQWGARGMALKGYNYQEILKYYYKNVSIE